LSGGTFDVALAQVDARFGTQLQPLALQSVVGRFEGRLLATGFEFSTHGLQFSTSDGVRWPGGNVTLVYTQAQGHAPAQGDIQADKLDLAALAQVAGRLPLGPAVHAALTAYAPKGLVQQVQGSWQGPLTAPVKFSARGRVEQLEIAAQPGVLAPGSSAVAPGKPAHVPVGRPGIRGATVDFDLNQAGGKAQIAVQAGALTLPGVFEDPVVPLDQLAANVRWQVDGTRIAAQLTNVKFSNADAQGELRLDWKTGDPATSPGHARFPGVLDLQGSLTRAQATRVYRYLPLVLPASVRDYVHDAVRAGNASKVSFAVTGDLHQLPFANTKQGQFHIDANLQDVTFAFVPRKLQATDAKPWPELTQLSAELVFDRDSMQIKGATGKFSGADGLPVARADAQIADLTHATVLVDAQTKGPLKDMLGFVANSPLDAITGQALTRATATGAADLKLHLELPLHDLAKSKVQGSVTLAGNDLQMSPDTPLLGKARAVVSFTERGFTIQDGHARLLGGDIRIAGGMQTPRAGQSDSPIVIKAEGSITALALQQAHELGAVARLAQSASGSTSYAAVLGFRKGVPDLLVTSSLQGLALSLPAPLDKSAGAALPLRLESKRLPSAVGEPKQDQISLQLGQIASATYVRNVSGVQAQVVRGAIAVGLGETGPPSLPDAGVLANVNLDSLNLDAWQALLGKAAGDSGASPAPAAAESDAGTPAAGSSGYLPTVLALRARQLTVQGRTLHNVVVGASRDGRTWRANLDADELDGYAEYREPAGAGAGRIYARLARLNIPDSSTSKVEQLLEKPSDRVPALDIV
ncbi:MAG: YhdP family protein, partial [Rhodoferax sp.]